MSDIVNIYIFNVGHGESIIIEFLSDSAGYVVIDSNLIEINSQRINPAYEFLKKNNISVINTLILTHLHRDHYNGIEYILNNFEINKIAIPPFLSTRSKQYNKIIDKYKKSIKYLVDRCADDEVFQYGKSLAYLLHFLNKNDKIIEEVTGKESILRFPGINNYNGIVYLPLKIITGKINQWIEQEGFDLMFFPQMNDSSIAFKLNCFGHNILLTGDSTKSQWMAHKIQMARDNILNLNVDCLKVPHHGSKDNNTNDLYNYYFNSNKFPKYAFTSADGLRHPDKEFFELVTKFDLIPYCTNLSQFCLPPNVLRFESMKDIPNINHPFLINYIEKKPIPCQGDLHIRLTSKEIRIRNSTGIPCIFHDNH